MTVFIEVSQSAFGHADLRPITPDWAAPPRVCVVQTTRKGGVSNGPFAACNLGMHVGDDPAAVRRNRERLRAGLPAEPVWLAQVHGVRVIAADAHRDGDATTPTADAAWTATPGVVCAVMTADCLPVVLADATGTRVAVAHAGWRGLADGVIEATLAALALPPGRLCAWLGPCIGPRGFVVGADVRERFVDLAAADATAFVPANEPRRWHADLAALGRRRLLRAGVSQVAGGTLCTWSDPQRFFSHRRDGAATGRMATLAWLRP